MEYIASLPMSMSLASIVEVQFPDHEKYSVVQWHGTMLALQANFESFVIPTC